MMKIKNEKNVKKCILIALLFIIVGSIKNFMGWQENGLYYDFIFISPTLSTWVEMILALLFCVFMVLYVYKKRSDLGASILLPAGIVALASQYALQCLIVVVKYIKAKALNAIWIPILFDLLPCVLLVLVVTELLKNGVVRKPLLWITVILVIFLSILPFIVYINTDYHWYTNKTAVNLYGLLTVVWSIGNILAYFSLLLILLKGRVPAIIPAVKNNTEGISCEQQLRMLKDRFELGLISEEEYQKEKEKIIDLL